MKSGDWTRVNVQMCDSAGRCFRAEIPNPLLTGAEIPNPLLTD